ncbi:MAG: D-alanine--D-alanine ligase [Candidatus Aceula meridiana]|nr:D-alanine--D-alanine ligase [Candidatus Aceula meridiana]
MIEIKTKNGAPLRIGVIMGGYSSEREISLKSGRAVVEALANGGYQVVEIDVISDQDQEISDQINQAQIDLAFVALHGHLGEDGRIQEIFEKNNIPYTGSGVEANRIAINKVLTYQQLEEAGICIPPYAVVQKGQEWQQAIKNKLSLPLVVKPCSEGSSIGITLVFKEENLADAVDVAFQYDDMILIERYIPGKELTVGILENKLLPVVEIRPKKEFFDFAAKYQSGMTDYVVPAPIESELTKQVQDIGLCVHKVMGCRHFSRVDIILDEKNIPYVLEINTIPGFTATSLLPKAAKAEGIDFTSLCLIIVELAYGTK